MSMSHSTRVRGLKFTTCRNTAKTSCRTLHECVDWNIGYDDFSKPTYSRTLHECVDWNIHDKKRTKRTQVALYTSAWIEIVVKTITLTLIVVALYTSAWIEIIQDVVVDIKYKCRTLHECVDWNDTLGQMAGWWFCRTLHECVDWNVVNGKLVWR